MSEDADFVKQLLEGDDTAPEAVPQDVEETEAPEDAPADDATDDAVDDEQDDQADDAPADEAEEEEPEGDAQEEEAEPAQTFKVKVDGEEVEATLEQLKQAYSGHAYVQKQMQEAAEVKRKAQQEAQAIPAKIEALAGMIDTFSEKLQRVMPKPPDASLIDEDPNEYLRQQAMFNAAQQEAHEMERAKQALAAEYQQQLSAAHAEHTAKELQSLIEQVPSLKTGDGKKEFAETLKSAQSIYGISAEEMRGLTSSKHLRVLHDAAQFHKLQAAKKSAEKKVATAPKLKAGARQTATTPNHAELLKKAKKSGRDEDFIAAILV